MFYSPLLENISTFFIFWFISICEKDNNRFQGVWLPAEIPHIVWTDFLMHLPFLTSCAFVSFDFCVCMSYNSLVKHLGWKHYTIINVAQCFKLCIHVYKLFALSFVCRLGGTNNWMEWINAVWINSITCFWTSAMASCSTNSMLSAPWMVVLSDCKTLWHSLLKTLTIIFRRSTGASIFPYKQQQMYVSQREWKRYSIL